MTLATLKSILNSKNEKKEKFWKFQTLKNKASKEAVLYFYGIFSRDKWYEDDITAKEFAKELEEIGDVDKISIRINSEGGNVFVAKAIASLLRSHKAEKVLYIDGICASAATFFLDQGKVVMAKDAFLMIHNAMTIGIGNKNEFMRVYNLLDKIDDSIANVYQTKTGQEKDDLTKLMDDETMMNANEALNLGFIDEIDESLEVAACIKSNELFINNVKFEFKNVKNMSKLENHLEKLLNKANTENINQSNNELINENLEIKNTNNTEDLDVKNLTLEALKKENPELLAQIENTAKEVGAKEERQRIQDIEDLDIKGHAELVQKAKFEDIMSADSLAGKVLKAEKETRTDYLKNSKEDAEVLNNIASADTSKSVDNSDEVAALIATGANR